MTNNSLQYKNVRKVQVVSFWAHLAQPPAHSRSQITQGFVQMILKTSKDGDVVVSLGDLLMLWLSLVKITFLTSSQKFPWKSGEISEIWGTDFVSHSPIMYLWRASLGLHGNLLIGTVWPLIDHPKATASPGRMIPGPSVSVQCWVLPPWPSWWMAYTEFTQVYWSLSCICTRGWDEGNWTPCLDMLQWAQSKGENPLHHICWPCSCQCSPGLCQLSLLPACAASTHVTYSLPALPHPFLQPVAPQSVLFH